MSGLVEQFVVIDAEHSACGSGSAPMPLTCGPKKRAATLDMTMKAVKPWKFGMLARIAYPGIFELAHSMGKVIGVLPEDAEIEGLVGVFPDVFSVDDQETSEGLREAGVELIAMAGAERHVGIARPPGPRLNRVDHGIVASEARQNQILVEGSFHGARVGGRITVLVALML